MDLDTLQWHLSCAPSGPLRARQANDYPHWNRWLDVYTHNAVADAVSASQKMSGRASVHFAVTLDDRINGQAFISKASDGAQYRFVTVTAGAILSIHQLCFYAMSRRDVLPSIGNVDLEVAETAPITFDPHSQYLVSVLEQTKLISGYPICPQRLEFAFRMARGAIYFLIQHEFAHCVNGHIWPRQASLEEHFTENILLSHVDKARKRHACELHADLCATRALFNQMYDELFRRHLNSWRKDLVSLELPASLYPSVTGVFLLFRMFGSPADIPTLKEDFYRGSHPHPIVRSRIIGSHFAGCAHGHKLKGADGWIWASAIALQSSSDIWEALTGEKEAVSTYALYEGTEYNGDVVRSMEYYRECASAENAYINELQSRTGIKSNNPYRPHD